MKSVVLFMKYYNTLYIISLEEDVDSNISSTIIVELCGLEVGRRLSKGCHYLNSQHVMK